MREKPEVAHIFKQFCKMIKNQFQTQIQILKTDNGRESFNNGLREFLEYDGIVHQSSCMHTLE